MGLENLYVIFLNSDFSFNIRPIPTKFLGDIFYNTPEGSMSQNYIFLCYVEILENYFFAIIYV